MATSKRWTVCERLLRSTGNTSTLILRDKYACVVNDDRLRLYASGMRVPNNNRLVLKLEHLLSRSPTGSLYDRVYPWLFQSALATGRVNPEQTHAVECSVGNAGAAFAFVARALGFRRYSVILPADIYPARIQQVRDLGADVVFSPPKIGPCGYVAILEDMLREERRRGLRTSDGMLRFCPISKIRTVPSEPYVTMVNEARRALHSAGEVGQIDAFVAVVGAGNTISLAGRYIRMLNPSAKVFAAEHAENPFVEVYFRGQTPPLNTTWSEPDFPATTIQGVPLEKLNLDLSVLNGVICLSRQERDDGLEALNNVLGLDAGRPSGLSFAAALRVCETVENSTVLAVVFDSAGKYWEFWNPVLTSRPLVHCAPTAVACNA